MDSQPMNQEVLKVQLKEWTMYSLNKKKYIVKWKIGKKKTTIKLNIERLRDKKYKKDA